MEASHSSIKLWYEYTNKYQTSASENISKLETYRCAQKGKRKTKKHVKSRSYWVFELLIDFFNHIFHAFKPSQNCILTKFIFHTKEMSHLPKPVPTLRNNLSIAINDQKQIKDTEAWKYHSNVWEQQYEEVRSQNLFSFRCQRQWQPILHFSFILV